MKTRIGKDIDDFVNELCRLFDPEKVILFGSHAVGKATPESDVDVLVLMDYKGKATQRAFEIRKAVRRNFPLDLIVRRPKDVSQRISQGDPFLREVMKNGRVVYERNSPGMGR
ncbi:MAG TPA: nucleotidyltransferase domain-containing protein [Deltaproteobacteria bacterium]|nr:nucleotidyltransferase domain-containing protein [Deltaproteobacteria bacterium]